jgi:SAM-dependent methyltransferase
MRARRAMTGRASRRWRPSAWRGRRTEATCSTSRAASRVTRCRSARPALLDEARRRAGGARWPKLVQADYRELPFADGSFDTALNLFSSLGYLGDAEDERALAEIGRVLRPGGRLVVETMHRDLLVSRFRDQDWQLVGEGRLLLEQRTFDPASGLVQATQTLIHGEGTRESRTFSVRVYTATELLAMLGRAGFDDARCFGDFDGAPFAPATRLVILAASS